MKREDRQNLKALAQELCRLEYEEIGARIQHLDTDALIELFNSRFRKVGDAAFACLRKQPDGEQAVIDAILQNRLTRRDSKVRGANFLEFKGRSHPEAIRAYFHLLDDKNEEVADNALFGIVLSQNPSDLARVRKKRDSAEPNTWMHHQLCSAVRALEDGNPFLYTGGYSADQAEELWHIKNARKKKEAANQALDVLRAAPEE